MLDGHIESGKWLEEVVYIVKCRIVACYCAIVHGKPHYTYDLHGKSSTQRAPNLLQCLVHNANRPNF